MPGFFLTFILLCFAGGWSRYLADRSGREWPMIIPGVGLGLWTLFTLVGVFTAATVGGTSGDVEADGMKLARVLAAAQYSRYLSIAVLVAMIPVTAVLWSRPAPEADRAG